MPLVNHRRALLLLGVLGLVVLALAGSFGPTKRSVAKPENRPQLAQDFFRKGLTNHLLSAEAEAGARSGLLESAAKNYEIVVRDFADQPQWAAQAARSLGNVRVEQGRLREAVQLYASVEKAYPTWDWEVLQSWKSAADLLWESGQQPQARQYYAKIVQRFHSGDSTPIMKLIVRASQRRLDS